jgi:hypothetical protein
MVRACCACAVPALHMFWLVNSMPFLCTALGIRQESGWGGAAAAAALYCPDVGNGCVWVGAEARGGLHIVEQSLWSSLPKLLRRVSGVLKKRTGRELPIDACPIRFGSWMGGDRDGNPNVTAKVWSAGGCAQPAPETVPACVSMPACVLVPYTLQPLC